MATPIILGVGALAAAIAGRSLLRSGALRIGAKGAQDQWVKGGFRAKMDRKEAIDILGLKCVTHGYSVWIYSEESRVRFTETDHH